MLTEESYSEPSWVSILVGNGLLPRRYDPLVDNVPDQELARLFTQRRAELARIAESMPTHEAFLERFCMAKAA
jgi:tryptophan halogenase